MDDTTVISPCTLQLSALGVPVTVRALGCRAHQAAAGIAEAWDWCRPGDRVAAGDPIVVDVILDDDPAVVASLREASDAGRVLAGTGLAGIMHDLSPAITVAAIGRRAGELLMLHACALADPRTGATLVLVGPSGMGKTTLARTLGTSLAYVTDETVAIRPDDCVLPYPKPLSVLNRTGSFIKEQVSPTALSLLPPPPHLQLHGVLLLDRSPSSPRTPVVEAVDPLRGIVEIVSQVSFLNDLTSPLHRLAHLMDSHGGLKRVRYREAAELAPILHELVGSGAEA